jgi:hydroxymethylbilane synthase
MIKSLKIGARRSDLARLQAYRVGQALEASGTFKIEYHFKESLGDKNLNDPLWKMPEKGVFTQDFVDDLLNAKVDLVVHSWKDLPTERPEGLKIIGTLPREDSRDLLFLKKSRMDSVFVRAHLRIFSSSPRRAHHLEPFLKWALPRELSKIEFLPVRGNIRTRIQKMLESDIDGMVMAKAAIDRLLAAPEKEFSESRESIRVALESCHFVVLPLEMDPCAAAQGALAIEAREDRVDLEQFVKRINCSKTFESVTLERQTLARYGGGCHQKIGVSCLNLRDGLFLRAKGELLDGTRVDEKQLFASKESERSDFSVNEIFPRILSDMDWFDREELKLKTLPDFSKSNAFLVAKSQALSNEMVDRVQDSTLWAAGLETWRKLARLGLWVSGCSESLGEENLPPRLEQLLPDSTCWWKLTHEGSQAESQMTPLFTYRMTPLKSRVPDLRTFKVFFWPSFSHFALANELFGDHLAQAQHFCGPGSSFDLIAKKLGRPPQVALSFDDFRRQITRSKSQL